MPLRFAEAATEAYAYPLLLRHILQSAIDTRSGHEIVGPGGRRHDYPELARRVGRLAQILADHGVGPGDTVAVMDWDSHRYLEAYFAVPMMGAVLQTVNVRLAPDQIAYTLHSTKPAALLVHEDFAALIDAVGTALPGHVPRISMHDGVGDSDYEILLAARDTLYPFVDFDENALATTFHTTGTTGLPKPVAFSHRQLVLHTLALTAALGIQPDGQSFRRDDVYMPITPMFHVHAWGLPYVATLLGVKQVYPGRYVADRLVSLQRREGVTFSHGVPTVVQMLVDAMGDTPSSSPWKMVVGGSACPIALRQAAAVKGLVVFAGYGMSETGPILTIERHVESDDGNAGDACVSVGHAVPLVQLKADGEVVARAPWLTQSYVGDGQASNDLWQGGWLHTQDVAEIDPTGALIIRDRLKDVIKTGGEWVSSAQMEDLTMRHEQVKAAAFIGVADDRWGERPIAFIVAAGVMPTIEDIRDYLIRFVENGAISRFALPDRVISIRELPRTSVGKIDKKALRLLVAAVSKTA